MGWSHTKVPDNGGKSAENYTTLVHKVAGTVLQVRSRVKLSRKTR
jgi:hypothetical protein